MYKFIFVGALILIVIIGGYLVLRDETEETPQLEENPITTYQNDEYGFTFVYPTDTYVFEDAIANMSEHPHFVYGLMLTNREEYEAAQNATDPREGPPTIQVRVYRNPERFWPLAWATENAEESNIGLAFEEPNEAVIGEANAIRYTADGLYPIDTFVVAHGGFIFLLTGSYLEFDAQIHHDFLALVESFTFIATPEQLASGIAPTFSTYPVEESTASITPAEPDFSTNSNAEEYREEIIEGAAEGPNFAGHYTVVTSNCGEGCEVSTILDAQDGSIITHGLLSSYGLSYDLKSALLIVNPKESLPEEAVENAERDAAAHFPLGAVPSRSDYYAIENDEFYFVGTFNVATGEQPICAQMISPARNPVTLEEREFGSPCTIPYGWDALETTEGGNGGAVTYEGEVVEVNLEAIALDGPARITILTDTEEEQVIAVPSMGLPLCEAYEAITPIDDVAVGDRVSVSGALSDAGEIVPCESSGHFLRIVE